MNRILTGLLAALIVLIPCANISLAEDKATITNKGGYVTASSSDDPITPGQRSLVSRWAQELYGSSDPKAWAAIACFNNKYNGTDINDVNWISAGQKYFLPSKALFDAVIEKLNSNASNFDSVIQDPDIQKKIDDQKSGNYAGDNATGDDDDDDDDNTDNNANGNNGTTDGSQVDETTVNLVGEPAPTVETPEGMEEGPPDPNKVVKESDLVDLKKIDGIDANSVSDEGFNFMDLWDGLCKAFGWSS